MYSSGNNIIGGSNVGVGLNQPTTKLHVRPDEYPTAFSVALKAAIGTPFRVDYYSDNDSPFRLKTAIFVKYDGNVGINTNNPTSQLHVEGHSNIVGNLAIGNNGWTSLTFDGTGNNDWMLNAHNNSTSFHIRGNTGTETGFNSYFFTINRNSGNVGIGNPNPQHKLDVSGSCRVTGTMNAQGFFTASNQSLFIGDATFISTAKFNNIQIGNQTITSGPHNTSNVKLTVDGHAIFKKVVVTQSNWADFVFADDYELPALSDVEEFIKRNKHLPNIPKEQEVLENGISLGDMDALLLQKIEELTLYMIQLHKKNDELEAILKSFK